jgi:histidine ammonia-lyase
MSTFTITDKELTLEDLRRFLASDMKIELSDAAVKKIKANRAFLMRAIMASIQVLVRCVMWRYRMTNWSSYKKTSL